MPSNNLISQLLELSHQLGREERKLAILGEGNTSVRLSEETFVVKASGSNLATLSEGGVSECRYEKLQPLIAEREMADSAIDQALFDSRISSDAKKPSVEAIFHGYLLTLPGVNFVGHTHPVAVNALLCSAMAGPSLPAGFSRMKSYAAEWRVFSCPTRIPA
jgi:rhamnose utilization protein RhaD (predicted bifunctional aldolase and dehydrogenase)